MKKFFLILGMALLFAGCGETSTADSGDKTAGDISVEAYVNAKAKRDYKKMWKCLSPGIQAKCGSFEAFKADQEETYKLLGDSAWQAMTDQMRQDISKIRAVEIDGKYYVDEK